MKCYFLRTPIFKSLRYNFFAALDCFSRDIKELKY
jgi:hypothetical protein